jgi:hypothetical protein
MMLNKAIAAILALALAGCGAVAGWVADTPRFEPDNRGVVVIANDGGGNVENYLSERRRLEHLGLPIEIRGRCASACVIFYSLPTACMASGARLEFHAVSGGGPLGPSVQARQIRDTLRAGVAEAYWDEWRFSDEFVRVPTREVMRLDPAVRECPPA